MLILITKYISKRSNLTLLKYANKLYISIILAVYIC